MEQPIHQTDPMIAHKTKLQRDILKNESFENKHLEHIKEVYQAGFLQPKILDIGCGTGITLAWLRGVFDDQDLMGIDLRFEDIQRARGRGLTAEVVDIQDFPFFNQQFGTVILSHVLEHISYLGLVVEHLHRIAKRLVIVVPKETVHEMNDNPAHVNVFPDFEELLAWFPAEKWKILEKVEKLGDLRLVLEKHAS